MCKNRGCTFCPNTDPFKFIGYTQKETTIAQTNPYLFHMKKLLIASHIAFVSAFPSDLPV